MNFLKRYKRKYVYEREKFERKRYTVFKLENGSYSVKGPYLGDVEWGIDEFRTLQEADAWAIAALREMAHTILHETENIWADSPEGAV
jgi:hypothetical protein